MKSLIIEYVYNMKNIDIPTKHNKQLRQSLSNGMKHFLKVVRRISRQL